MNLKARVDALRQADESTRARSYSLDHFLEGDDVLTGREVVDHYTPSGFDPAGDSSRGPDSQHEVDLEAELQKYLLRQEEQTQREPAAEAPKPVQPAAPEGGSLVLDGTWSRDDVGRPAASQPVVDATSPAERALPPSAGVANAASSAWPESPDSPWPDSKQWPSEEEWPPREEQAI